MSRIAQRAADFERTRKEGYHKWRQEDHPQEAQEGLAAYGEHLHPQELDELNEYRNVLHTEAKVLKDEGLDNMQIQQDGQALVAHRKLAEIARDRARYVAWANDNFDWKDPTKLPYLSRVFPEVIEAKKEVIEERFDLARKLAKIKLTGVQTSEDAKLVFMIENGDIDPEVVKVATDISKPGGKKSDAYVAGLLGSRFRLVKPGDKPISSGYVRDDSVRTIHAPTYMDPTKVMDPVRKPAQAQQAQP